MDLLVGHKERNGSWVLDPPLGISLGLWNDAGWDYTPYILEVEKRRFISAIPMLKTRGRMADSVTAQEALEVCTGLGAQHK